LQIQDFDIDRLDNRVWVYDNHSSKFIVYDESLTNYEETRLPIYFLEFAIKGPDSIYVRNLYSEGKILHRVAELNTRDMKYKSLMDNGKNEVGLNIVSFGQLLNRSGENVLFTPRFKGSIFRIINGKMENVLNVIAPFPDESLIEKYRNQPMDVLQEEGHTLAIIEIFENESLLTFKIFETTPSNAPTVIYSIETKQAFRLELFNQEKYFGDGRIVGVAENKFISLNEPSHLHEDFLRKKIQESPLSEENKSTLLNAQPSDNPIIILFDFIDY
jgi:hypothetical protein